MPKWTSAQPLRALLNAIDPNDLVGISHNWELLARDDQIDTGLLVKDWRIWLLMGGRGSGKTRAGAEWIRLWHGPGILFVVCINIFLGGQIPVKYL